MQQWPYMQSYGDNKMIEEGKEGWNLIIVIVE